MPGATPEQRLEAWRVFSSVSWQICLGHLTQYGARPGEHIHALAALATALQQQDRAQRLIDGSKCLDALTQRPDLPPTTTVTVARMLLLPDPADTDESTFNEKLHAYIAYQGERRLQAWQQRCPNLHYDRALRQARELLLTRPSDKDHPFNERVQNCIAELRQHRCPVSARVQAALHLPEPERLPCLEKLIHEKPKCFKKTFEDWLPDVLNTAASLSEDTLRSSVLAVLGTMGRLTRAAMAQRIVDWLRDRPVPQRGAGLMALAQWLDQNPQIGYGYGEFTSHHHIQATVSKIRVESAYLREADRTQIDAALTRYQRWAGWL